MPQLMNLSGCVHRSLATQPSGSSTMTITWLRVRDQACPIWYQELFPEWSKRKRELVSFFNRVFFQSMCSENVCHFQIFDWYQYSVFYSWFQEKEDMARCGRGVGTGTRWLSRSSARVTRFRLIAKLRSTQPFCFDTKTFSDTSDPIVRHIIHAHSYGLSHISTQMDHSSTI